VLIQGSSDPPRLVRVGIDAAIVAQHEVCIRATDADGRVRTDRFHVQPTLAGLQALSNRLAEMPGVVAVAEPTSMTWLGLSVALRDAGCDLSLLGARHAARLRGAISGKHKSDVIDADVLARAGEVFDLHPLWPVEPAQLALRRACAPSSAAAGSPQVGYTFESLSNRPVTRCQEQAARDHGFSVRQPSHGSFSPATALAVLQCRACRCLVDWHAPARRSVRDQHGTDLPASFRRALGGNPEVHRPRKAPGSCTAVRQMEAGRRYGR
jgi:hypothetical protein